MATGMEELLAIMFDCEGCKHPFHFGECPVRVWANGDKDDCGCEGPPKKKRSCNRHSDCDKANARYKVEYGRDPGYNFHCHDEDCEDCFGK